MLRLRGTFENTVMHREGSENKNEDEMMDKKSEQGWVRKQDKLQTDRGTKHDSEFSTLQGRPCQCVAEAGARTSGLGPH